jgi:hypothetical protein
MDGFIKEIELDTKVIVAMQNGHQHTGTVSETSDPDNMLVIYSDKQNPTNQFKPYGMIYMRLASISHIIIMKEGD